jgi:hypothetical protein
MTSKEETQKLVFDLKEDMNKQLNELKGIQTNRLMTEHQTIRTIKDTHPDISYSKYSAHRTKKEF